MSTKKSAWREYKLGDICDEIISGSGFPKKYQGLKEGDFPFAKVGDLSFTYRNGNKYIYSANNYLNITDAKKIKAKIFPENSIVFPKVGEALKNNYRLITKTRMLFDNNIMGITIKDKFDIDFIYWFLRKTDFTIFSVATTVPSIRKTDIENIRILIPLLEEQKLIVEKIESEFQKIDNALNKLNIIKEQIKQYKQSVLKYAFDENNSFAKGSNYEPYEWEEKILDDVCYINPTTIIPEDFNDDTEVSFLPMANVEACTNNYTENIEKYQKVKKGYTKFQENDILFAKITPCMENGKICVINKLKSKIGFGSTEFHVIRNKENVFIDFIYYFVSSEEFRMNAKQKMTGAVGQKRVPASYLMNHIIKIPNIELQKTIADNIQNIFDKVDNIENNINENIDKLNVLKQSILKKAFEGKLI